MLLVDFLHVMDPTNDREPVLLFFKIIFSKYKFQREPIHVSNLSMFLSYFPIRKSNL